MFLGLTIFNSTKVLLLINLFNEEKIALVISGLDISAIVAANFCGIKSYSKGAPWTNGAANIALGLS